MTGVLDLHDCEMNINELIGELVILKFCLWLNVKLKVHEIVTVVMAFSVIACF